ncbi:MAG: hypothetical protein ACI4BB_03500 [Coprococcus sp.]
MNENKILKNLDRGIETEQTLKEYARVLSEGYMKLSFCKLAVNFSTYYDDLEKAGSIDGEKTQKEFKIFLELTAKLIGADAIGEADIRRLDGLREGLRERMQSLYDYVHILGLYEHVLSRLQYRYEEKTAPVDVEALMMEIHGYICQDPEPSGMNERMQNMMGEMPIRMTRSRFLDLVSKSCSCYKGTRSDIADYFFNDMYQQAQLPHADDLNPAYEELQEIVRDMEAIDFDSLDEEKVKNALDKLQIAGQQLGQAFSYDFQLIELINDLYILMLNSNFAGQDREVAPLAVRCISSYMKAAREQNFLGMDEDIVDDLGRLNDQQQKLVGMHILFEDQLLSVMQRYQDIVRAIDLEEHFQCLRLSNILAGVDMTAELDTGREIFVADRDYIAKKTDKLLEMYTSVFNNYPMIIRRAVISDALMKLPVACDSLEECEQLILQSFENCRDQVEIMASAELMRMTMREEEKWQE